MTQTMTFCIRPLRHLLWLLPLLLWSSVSFADSLSATVDRTRLSIQDTFALTLRFSGATPRSEPDMTLLQRDFDILGNQRSNQMRVINNQMESWTEWRITLAPKRSGQTQIPAFEVDGQRSQPIALEILQQQQISGDSQQDIFLELDLDKERLYVQEQLLFTVRLYTAVNLRAADLEPLELPDAVILEVADNRFHRQINGRTYAVIERTFAVFPQRSGELVIPSLRYNVAPGTGRRDIWGDLQGGNQGLRRLRTDEKRLTVRTIPNELAGQPWLPARQVELREHWSGSLDQVTVGEPITRTITLSAEGLTAGQLPSINAPGAEGINLYPDQPQTDEQRDAQGVRGTRIETLAMVPQRSGYLTLPETTLQWWNTQTGQLETARLPAVTLDVRPAPGGATATRNPSGSQPLPPLDLDGTPQIVTAQPLPWIAATGTLAIISLLLALLYTQALLRLRRQSPTESDERPRLTDGALWKQVKQTAAARQLPALRQALIAWAQVHWENPGLHSLEQIARTTGDERLQQQLRALDAALYRGESVTEFDPGDLLQAVQESRMRKRDGDDYRGLQPLYPKS